MRAMCLCSEKNLTSFRHYFENIYEDTSQIYRPYIESVIDDISSRMESSDILYVFSIFDPIHLPDSEVSLST